MSTQTSLHLRTPLFEALDVASPTGRRTWLKMECFQPTGSFKLRGIGLLCQRSAQAGKKLLVSSSGGNAGLAVAYSARALDVAATVVVPSSTPVATRDRLMKLGARVVVHGEAWDDADVRARELAADESAAYVPPFDHPVIWEGHATLVDEIVESGVRPDAIVVAVGGGGLLCGVLEGLHRHGWTDMRVIAVETKGAESLHLSILAGKLITLPAITSIAKSLGARRVAAEALEWTRRHPIESVVVMDAAALAACARFAVDQRVLVEPACGAALAVAYDDHECLRNARSVVVIVCGGVSIEPVLQFMGATG